MQVNPADIRFTQDSICLYFQNPYNHFSVRDAVRKISRNKMAPDDFPLIRVNSYGGYLWSVDNRRLWVFRLARCSSIAVKLVKKIHPRLRDVLSNSDLHSMMQVEDFFPRVRDRGQVDRNFDRCYPQPVASLQRPINEALENPSINTAQVDRCFPQPAVSLQRAVNEALENPPINMAQVDRCFPQPVASLQRPVNEAFEKPPIDMAQVDRSFPLPAASLQRAVNEALEKPSINMAKVSTVDTEKSGTSTMPPKPSINHVQEIAKDEHQIDIPPQRPSVNPMVKHAKDEQQSETAHLWNAFAIARKIANVGRMTRDAVGNLVRNIFSVQSKIAAAVARRIASFGRIIKNAVGSFFRNIFCLARKTATAVARRIASLGRMTKNAVGSFVWNIFCFGRKTVAAVARKIAAYS